MDMDANSAIGFCKDQKTVSQKLNILKQLGLGYLTPGEETPSLSNMPERCPKPKDLALAAKGYRYLIVKNYLVFYVIVGDTVQITAGPLEGFMGLVEAIDTENFKVKLKVNMFGRETPAEVEIGQVELP